MCGLVGMLGAMSRDKLKTFHTMLWLDQLRGDHSTGAAAIKKKHIDIVKDATKPGELQELEEYDKLIDNLEAFCLIGHNRYATKGEVTPANAHPFRHGRITLAHNGTLWQHNDLIPGKHFDTDSEAMTAAINEYGIDEAWKKFNGAAAITFWDNKEKTMNIITNGKRSISIRFTKDKRGVLWSSEPWMMQVSAMRSKLELDDELYYPDNNVLISFKYNQGNNTLTWDQRKLEEYRYVAPSYAPNYRAYNHRHGGFEDDAPPFVGQQGKTTGGTTSSSGSISTEKVGTTRSFTDNHGRLIEIIKTARSDLVKVTYPTGETAFWDINTAISNKLITAEWLNGGTANTVVPFRQENHSSKSSSNVCELPYTEDDPDPRQKSITEAKFHERYKSCSSCGYTLEHEFEESVIVDHRHAICSECFKVAKQNGMSAEAIAKGA